MVESSLSPVRAIDGGSVLVNGVGMAKTTTFTITFDGKSIGSVKTTSTGTLSFNYTIPLTTLVGIHTFNAKDAKGDSSSATFTTISKVTLTPPKGFAGNVTKVTITGFAASSTLTIKLGGNAIPGQLPGHVYSNGIRKVLLYCPAYRLLRWQLYIPGDLRQGKYCYSDVHIRITTPRLRTFTISAAGNLSLPH